MENITDKIESAVDKFCKGNYVKLFGANYEIDGHPYAILTNEDAATVSHCWPNVSRFEFEGCTFFRLNKA